MTAFRCIVSRSSIEALVAQEGGFATNIGGDVEAALQRRGGLSLAFPASADEEIHFHLPGGFDARVRELGASGKGAVIEHAVAYARDGGTSYWAVTEEGYEEWLLLDAAHAKSGVPVAAWEVTGATLR